MALIQPVLDFSLKGANVNIHKLEVINSKTTLCGRTIMKREDWDGHSTSGCNYHPSIQTVVCSSLHTDLIRVYPLIIN